MKANLKTVQNVSMEEMETSKKVLIELVEEEPSKTYNWVLKYFDFQNIDEKEMEEILDTNPDIFSEMSFDEVLAKLKESEEEINKYGIENSTSDRFYYESF